MIAQEKPMDRMMSTQEVCTYLGVTPEYLYNCIKRGELKGYKVGREYRYKVSAVEAFLDSKEVKV